MTSRVSSFLVVLRCPLSTWSDTLRYGSRMSSHSTTWKILSYEASVILWLVSTKRNRSLLQIWGNHESFLYQMTILYVKWRKSTIRLLHEKLLNILISKLFGTNSSDMSVCYFIETFSTETHNIDEFGFNRNAQWSRVRNQDENHNDVDVGRNINNKLIQTAH